MSTTPDTPKLTRAEQSRINGAQSRGPITPEGKAISSSNAVKHGFAAAINVVLTVEDRAAFELHVAGVRTAFKPANYFEEALVDQLAAIQWRQGRLTGLETALVDAQVSLQAGHIFDTQPTSSTNRYFHLVQAWQALARRAQPPQDTKAEDYDAATRPEGYDINGIELLRRYQTSLDRQFRNTLLNLRQYRKDFANHEEERQQPEQTEPAAPKPQVAVRNEPEPNRPQPRSQSMQKRPPTLSLVPKTEEPGPIHPASPVAKR